MAGNIILPNLKGPTNQDNFYGIWSLTRALKAAGWIYKSSADGTNMENGGNTLADKWGPGAVYQSVQLGAQTGSTAVVSSISGTSVTITGLTGMTASSVGHGLTLSGATNSNNNGTFTIISFISATSVTIWNPSAVVEVTNLTWTEVVSGSGASIAASVGDEAILTGLSGLTTTTSPGHLITITNASNGGNNGTFRISAVLSATSCKIKNSAAVLESGSLIWVENNPTGDIYPQTQFTSVAAWINMQGPSTLKIPITAASTGTFVRGENVTQSTTGAQGELLGYLYDSNFVTGYLVILPRVDGTGGGVHGWSSSNAITGSISGASVNANGTPIEFVREFVFWKNTNVFQGWIAYQCVDQSAENTSRFSYLASNAAGVTATVAPGGGGTNNTFPSVGTMICVGATVSTRTNWDMQSTTPSVYGRQQIVAFNATNTSGVSADGSFVFVQGRPDLNSQYCSGWIFTRCDNGEDGDVDPYVWYAGNGGGNYSGSRTSCLSGGNTDMWSTLNAGNTQSQGRGFRRRGFSTFDTFQQFTLGGVIGQINNNNNSYWALNINTQDNDSVACAFSPTKVREPLFVLSIQLGQKMRKGTCRWMFATAGGSNMDTYDSRTWVQVSSNTGGNAGSGPFIIGPWDGVSNPLQA